MTPEQVKFKLLESFTNSTIEVTDLTGTQDHYEVYITSKTFEGKSRIQQHKMVMLALDPELKSGEIHALSIKTSI